MAEVDVIDFNPDDEEQLCLYVHPRYKADRWRFSLGHDWAKIHINDVGPGGRAAAGGIYKFPMLLPVIHRLRYYANDENCLFTEWFLEEALRLLNQEIASEIQLRRLKNLERWSKEDFKHETTPTENILAKQANGKAFKAEARPRDILVGSAEGSIKSPFFKRVPSKRKPYLHQQVIREYAVAVSNPAILCDPGTGKTQAMAEALWWRYLRGHIESVLVVCPLSIVENWEREINELTDLSALALTAPGTSGKLKMLEERWWWNQVIVVNYESVPAIMKWLDENLNWSKTYVIADESTKIKNPSAKRSKIMHRIGRKAAYKAILTGTPITQGSWDVYSQFLFLDGGATFGNSHKRFIETYFWRNPRYPSQVTPRPGANETISEKMYLRGVRYTKAECLDLPDKIYSRRFVRLPEYQADVYRRIQIDAIANLQSEDLEVTAPIVLVELLRLAQITSGHITGKKTRTEAEIIEEMLKKEGGWVDPQVKATVFFKKQPKLEMLKLILKDEAPEEQVVIWTRFIPERKLITDMLKKEKITFSSFDTHEKQEAVDLFQSGKARCFVANPASAGHGITLTAASLAVYLSNSFSLEQRQQSEDRIHRIGAVGENCRYIDIVVPSSIDEYVLDVLMQKGDVASEILRDGVTNFLKWEPEARARPVDWWRKVLGIKGSDGIKEAEANYRAKALLAHPDMGGTEEEMRKLNDAIIEARKNLPKEVSRVENSQG